MRGKQLGQGLLIALLLLIAGWLISLIWGLSGKAQIAVNEANSAKRQYQALEDRKTVLQVNLSSLATERGRDAAIRTAFGVARPGEEVIVVVPPEPSTTTPSLSWWQKLLELF